MAGQQIVVNVPPNAGKKKRTNPEDSSERDLKAIKERYGDSLTAGLWLKELWALKQVEGCAVKVYRRDGTSYSRFFKRGHPPFDPAIFANDDDPESVQLWLATNFGDGKFNLQALINSAQRGWFPVEVNLGIKDGIIPGAGTEGKTSTEIRAEIAKGLGETIDVLNLQDMKRSLEARQRGEDDGMKAGDMKDIMVGLAEMTRAQAELAKANAPPAAPPLSIDDIRRIMREEQGQSPLAAFTPLFELFKGQPLGQVFGLARTVLNRFAPAPERTVPMDKPLTDQIADVAKAIMPTVDRFLQTPVGQAITAQLLARMQGADGAPPVVITEAPRPAIEPKTNGAPTEDQLRARQILDTIMTELLRAPDDRDFPALRGFLESIVVDQASDTRLLDRVMPITQTLGAHGEATAMTRLALGQIDPRLTEQAWEGAQAFLAWLKEHGEAEA